MLGMRSHRAAALALGLWALSASASPPQIHNLGSLSGYQISIGYSVSTGGTVVAGYCEREGDGMRRAFRWTAETGMTDLGTLGGSSVVAPAVAFAVSDNGLVIVGDARRPGDIAGRAFRHTASGMVELGILGTGGGSIAFDTNHDGSVIVGWSYIDAYGPWQAFKWTAPGPLVAFNTPKSYANATNPDGSVAVGQYLNSADHMRAVRWVGSEELELGTLGGHESRAYDLSDDGSVVVGFSGKTMAPTDAPTHAYRWTAGGGLEDLGTLGGKHSYAYRVSRDGNIVFGNSVLPPPGNEAHAFMWTRYGGMQDLHDVLESKGVDLDGWQLTSVGNLSSDGTSLVGTGVIGGQTRAWLVTGLSLGCVGDYNGFGDAGDILDFLDFFQDFGTCDQQPAPCGSLGNPDVNGDTSIDILDFLDFLDAFGQGC